MSQPADDECADWQDEEETKAAPTDPSAAIATANTSAATTASPISSYVTAGGVKRKVKADSAADGNASAAAKRAKTDTAPFHFFAPVAEHGARALQTVLLGHFFPGRSSFHDGQYNSLPGPQPASMTRGELSLLENGDYWVCEKSDGERAVLVMRYDTRCVYVVDRKLQFRAMHDKCAAVLASLFSRSGDTVLDAELIESTDATGGHTVHTFSIFDVVAFNGQHVADRPFGGCWKSADGRMVSDGSGRMDVIMDRVRAPYKSHLEKTLTNTGHDSHDATVLLDRHFKLIVKEFLAKHHVSQILDRVTVRPSHHSFFSDHYYQHGTRVNSNDGLIFTPDHDNYFNKNIPLLKWKWPDLNTIDFKVIAPYRFDEGKGLPLYVRANTRGGGGRLEAADVLFDYLGALDAQSRQHYSAIVQHGAPFAVVECGYSRRDSDWHIKAVRWDKAQPNFQSTVIGTLKSVIDDVGAKDITEVCKRRKMQYRMVDDRKC